MRLKTFSLFCVFTIFFSFSFAVTGFCGITLHKQTYMLIPGKGTTRLLQSWVEYAQGNKVAVYQKNAVFITDIATNTLINIIPSRKIYAVNDIDEFIKKIEKIVAQIKQQQPQGWKKPGGKPLNVVAKKTGKKKNFLGYPAELFEIYSNNVKVRDVWITDKIPLKKEIDVEKAFEKRFKIEDIFVELSGTKDIEATPEYKNLFKGGRVSMMMISYNNGSEEIERVTQVEIAKIPEHIFEVPRGFKKVPIEQFMRH